MKAITKNLLKLIFIFFIVYAENSISQEKDPLEDWCYRKEISVTDSSGYSGFFLDNDVYKYANIYLSDLRIIDRDSLFVPYLLEDRYWENKEDLKSFKTKKIYSKKDKDGNSYFDFQIIENHNDSYINLLRLIVDKYDFSNQIEISGRTGSSDWQFIALTSVYRFSNVSKDEVELPLYANYNFFRIKVVENAQNISIDSLKAISSVRIEKQQKYIKNTDAEYKIENMGNKTWVSIKNPDHLKIIKLALETKGNFNRTYYLYSDTSQTYLSSGEIFNFQYKNVGVSNFDIPIDEYAFTGENDIIMQIANNDNQPVEITKITVSYMIDKVIFENKNNCPCYLYFGNENAARANYDISSQVEYISRLDISGSKLLKTEKLKNENNTLREKKDYTKLFKIMVFIVGIFLVILIVVKLKKTDN